MKINNNIPEVFLWGKPIYRYKINMSTNCYDGGMVVNYVSRRPPALIIDEILKNYAGIYTYFNFRCNGAHLLLYKINFENESD